MLCFSTYVILKKSRVELNSCFDLFLNYVTQVEEKHRVWWSTKTLSEGIKNRNQSTRIMPEKFNNHLLRLNVGITLKDKWWDIPDKYFSTWVYDILWLLKMKKTIYFKIRITKAKKFFFSQFSSLCLSLIVKFSDRNFLAIFFFVTKWETYKQTEWYLQILIYQLIRK